MDHSLVRSLQAKVFYKFGCPALNCPEGFGCWPVSDLGGLVGLAPRHNGNAKT